MNLISNIIINIYSIAILTSIGFYSSKRNENEDENLQYKLYMMMLYITILLLIVDIFSRLDGDAVAIYPVLNSIGNFVIFMVNPILPSLWLLYVHYEVFQEVEKTKEIFYVLIPINVIHVFMVVVAQFHGWFYYIDADNIFHRGQFYLISAVILISLVIITFAIIVINHKKIEKKHYFSLVFFSIPPFISIILQIAFYELSLMLNSVALSLLIVFLYIQNDSIFIDGLTGVYNRKKLEIYLKEKIYNSSVDKTFSAIMFDLDNFKYINDTYGHNIGDNALQSFATVLRNSLRTNDFIARFGGDEFVAILDISNIIELEEVVNRINSDIEKFNDTNERPYNIYFSMGYVVYDYNSHMKAKDFLIQIDSLMYADKKGSKN